MKGPRPMHRHRARAFLYADRFADLLQIPRETDVPPGFGEEEAFQEWFRTFTKKKEPYSFGEMVQLKNHAKTLRLIAQTNGKAFYEGEIAEQFIKQSQRDGGYFCKEDLSTYEKRQDIIDKILHEAIKNDKMYVKISYNGKYDFYYDRFKIEIVPMLKECGIEIKFENGE